MLEGPEACGFVASIMFVGSLLPQIYRVSVREKNIFEKNKNNINNEKENETDHIEDRRQNDVSPTFVLVGGTASGLMLVYAVDIGATPIIFNNAACLVLNIILAITCYRNGWKSN